MPRSLLEGCDRSTLTTRRSQLSARKGEISELNGNVENAGSGSPGAINQLVHHPSTIPFFRSELPSRGIIGQCSIISIKSFNILTIHLFSSSILFRLFSIGDLLHMHMYACVLVRSLYPITPVRTFYVVKIKK